MRFRDLQVLLLHPSHRCLKGAKVCPLICAVECPIHSHLVHDPCTAREGDAQHPPFKCCPEPVPARRESPLRDRSPGKYHYGHRRTRRAFVPDLLYNQGMGQGALYDPSPLAFPLADPLPRECGLVDRHLWSRCQDAHIVRHWGSRRLWPERKDHHWDRVARNAKNELGLAILNAHDYESDRINGYEYGIGRDKHERENL